MYKCVYMYGVCIVYKCVWYMYCVCVVCECVLCVCVLYLLYISVCMWWVCIVYKYVYVHDIYIVYKCVFMFVWVSWSEGVSGHKETLFWPGALIVIHSAMSSFFPQAGWLTEHHENILFPTSPCLTPTPVWAPQGSTEPSGCVTASTRDDLSVFQEGKDSHPRGRLVLPPLNHVTLWLRLVGEGEARHLLLTVLFLPLGWKSANHSPWARPPLAS